MGTQFSLHKISYDPDWRENWSDEKGEEMMILFGESKRKLLGPTYHWTDEESPKFQEWAASWSPG